MRLSTNFTLAEMTVSQTAARRGIDNEPGPETIVRLSQTCAGLERVRALLGNPIFISSGYRSPELNVAIGGSANSAHTRGWAADFVCPGFGDTPAVVQAIAKSDIMFDQLIEEFGRWTHISFDPRNRRQVLRATRQNGKVVYEEV